MKQRGDRNGGNGRHGARRDTQERPRLDWQMVGSVERECVVVEINRAIGKYGPLYSIRAFRAERGRESIYFRPDDLTAWVEALQEAHQKVMVMVNQDQGRAAT